ncbi:ArdC family protein [Vitreimonas flagellata]|uniref:ArdC family protein n=1 Tax=Vitreimonas flagellata TaxID=2560861 RepID=UPI001074AD67|nr:zincin-like metallopeptidase domain-containing protein [Vitreimonas flagellata]
MSKQNTDRHRSPRRDIAADINAKILADLESGVLPWRKPWDGARVGGPPGLPLRASGEPYRGINVIILWNAACEANYQARTWLTFNQALQLGGAVRKGEKGQAIVYYGSSTRTRTDDAGDSVEETLRFLKSYVVFNAEQIDGLDGDFYTVPGAGDACPLATHEAWFSKLDIARIQTADLACYIPSRDVIGMPPIAAFDSAEHYAQTLNHECVHATKAPHRLDRDFAKRYPEHHYYVEEICAELGAAYLSAHLGLSPGHLHDHSAYIDHWVKLLKHDRRAFLDAAAKAQVAVDWLLNKSPIAA